MREHFDKIRSIIRRLLRPGLSNIQDRLECARTRACCTVQATTPLSNYSRRAFQPTPPFDCAPRYRSSLRSGTTLRGQMFKMTWQCVAPDLWLNFVKRSLLSLEKAPFNMVRRTLCEGLLFQRCTPITWQCVAPDFWAEFRSTEPFFACEVTAPFS